MGRRTPIVLLVAVMLLTLPALCAGGLLRHDCGSYGDRDGHDMCANDPCSGMIRSDESLDDGVEVLAPTTVVALVSEAVVLETNARALLRAPRPGWPPPRPLAYHASDIPLRI